MIDKRKHPRVNVYVLASYDCYNNDGEVYDQKLGVILDVSIGGMLIESDGIVEANYVEVVFINHEKKVLSIVGSVVHSRKDENGKVKTGLGFHGTERENIKIVTNLIRTHNYGSD
jgi:c-di-GMP-binding flagellar brake protein YcgR